ncbi:MAG: hypothetical protein WD597_10095 [Balneolaceae bacterium]
MRILIITFVSIILLSPKVEAQTIHKNAIKEFVGVLVTTPLNKPDTWPDNQPFVKNKPLETSFYKYFLDANPWQLQKEFQYDGKSNSAYSILSVPDNSRYNFTLDIPEKDWKIIFFRNNQFEGGTNYISIWKTEGDSLHFHHLLKSPLFSGIAIMGIDSKYMINAYDEVFLATLTMNPNENYEGYLYSFYKLNSDFTITHLFEERTASSFSGIELKPETKRKDIFNYDYIQPHFLMINKITLNGKREGDMINGREYYNYQISDSTIVLKNLNNLLNQSAN